MGWESPWQVCQTKSCRAVSLISHPAVHPNASLSSELWRELQPQCFLQLTTLSLRDPRSFPLSSCQAREAAGFLPEVCQVPMDKALNVQNVMPFLRIRVEPHPQRQMCFHLMPFKTWLRKEIRASGVAPANQIKERSVHELFAGAFRNKSSM